VKFINTNTNENSSKEYVEALAKQLTTLADICGLILERKEEILDQEIEDLIAARQAARKEKNFKLADEIRDTLLQKGIILEDTREGVKWKRA
jgi:cysteinyl-tRNA synthetase